MPLVVVLLKALELLFNEKIKEYVCSFDAVSVREKSTCDFLCNVGVSCNTTVDPTLIIDRYEWDYLAEKSKINLESLPQDYIFVYDLEGTEGFANVVSLFSESSRLPVISMRKRKHYRNDTIRFPNASPYEFIALIKNAKVVISNSYHAMIFGFIYRKKVTMVPHSKYSERMSNFLQCFHISLHNDPVEIDFSKVNIEEINQRITLSRDFIRENIEVAK